MGYSNSPLRFPGGKTILWKFLGKTIKLNNLSDGVYVEPYAGGAGVAINLLFAEYVHEVMLNDADPLIYKFWKSILFQTERFIRLIHDTPVNIKEWEKQRRIFKQPFNYSDLKVGFSAFYLNRCNRSGILHAGPIGGKHQLGKWDMSARFNKKNLIKRIEKIALYSTRISLFNKDAIDFLETDVRKKKSPKGILVYLDPPYYKNQGKNRLYLNFYHAEDHKRLANFITSQSSYMWLISYDNVPEIWEIYKKNVRNSFELNYSAYKQRIGSELIISCPELLLPEEYRISRNKLDIQLNDF